MATFSTIRSVHFIKLFIIWRVSDGVYYLAKFKIESHLFQYRIKYYEDTTFQGSCICSTWCNIVLYCMWLASWLNRAMAFCILGLISNVVKWDGYAKSDRMSVFSFLDLWYISRFLQSIQTMYFHQRQSTSASCV